MKTFKRLIAIFLLDSEERRPFYSKDMIMIEGAILCGDHSFKAVKLVYHKKQKIFEGLFTLMNGKGEIVGFWMTENTSLKCIEEQLRGVAKRFRIQGNIHFPLL